MKNLLNRSFLLLTLLFTLLAIAFPASAEELQEFVAGTEFEPNPLNQYAAHPFYLGTVLK